MVAIRLCFEMSRAGLDWAFLTWPGLAWLGLFFFTLRCAPFNQWVSVETDERSPASTSILAIRVPSHTLSLTLFVTQKHKHTPLPLVHSLQI